MDEATRKREDRNNVLNTFSVLELELYEVKNLCELKNLYDDSGVYGLKGFIQARNIYFLV